MSDAPDLRTLVENSIPFVQRMGLRLDAVERGFVRMTAPLEPNVNHIGTMYAGALFTLAEVPGGALFMATFDLTKAYPIVKGMDIRFVAPATTDISVEVRMPEDEIERLTTEVEANGKADYSWESVLVDAAGKVVARTVNDYQMRRHGI